jgi:hypothetical protein
MADFPEQTNSCQRLDDSENLEDIKNIRQLSSWSKDVLQTDDLETIKLSAFIQ